MAGSSDGFCRNVKLDVIGATVKLETLTMDDVSKYRMKRRGPSPELWGTPWDTWGGIQESAVPVMFRVEERLERRME